MNQQVRTPFGQIGFRQTGAGPVALFVHGVFLNGDLWHHQLDGLADLRRCVAVDLLAHGDSDCPEGGRILDVELQAEMVLSFLDGLGVAAVDLVGNDTGGAIAQIVAARAPERIRTLTLTNCDTHDNWPPPAFAPIYEMASGHLLADALTTIAGDPGSIRSALDTSLEHAGSLTDDTLTGFFAPFATRARAEAVEEFVAHMDNRATVAIEGALARFESPTLIVWGTGDGFFGVEWARWLAATIPGARPPVELEGARLFFPLERPDDLNRALRTLWTGDPVDAGSAA